METTKNIIYESSGLTLISALLPTKNGMALQWKQWKPRYIEIYEDATMVYRKSKGTPVKATYNLSKVLVTSMAHTVTDPNDNTTTEKGITIKCATDLGIEAQFRCIFVGEELHRFTDALKSVAADYQTTTTKRSSYIPTGVVESTLKPTVSPKKSTLTSFLPFHSGAQSVMRSTIAYQMDKYELLNTKERIIARRGALKWLPVLFTNDLVHGSWWFVIGSLLFMVSSIIMIGNSNHTLGLDLGGDDSNLSPSDFRLTWGLMLLSGIFSTLGSMAFVRAVHHDPPMKPLLINWYHFQNDELLGSWLFLLAVIPGIPYCIVYLANDGYNSYIFLGGLVLACVFAFATFLFVRACYPNDKKRMKILKPVSRVLCWCCCKKNWMKKHLANDWLAGTWFFLWASLPATVICFAMMIEALAYDNNLKVFLTGTTFVENFCFLIGSCYFVSGSYPETSLVTDEEWDDHSVGSSDPVDQHTGEEGHDDVDDHDDPDELESGLRMGGVGGGRGGSKHSKLPVNDLAYDEGHDDSDDESVEGVGSGGGAGGGLKSLGFRVSEHNPSALAAAAAAQEGDTSPSIKNPLTRGL